MPLDNLPVYVLTTMLIIALSWEALWPRRPERSGLAYRWTNNLLLTFIGLLLSNASRITVTAITAWFSQHYQLGILSNLDLGGLSSLLVTILVFELLGYGIHMLFHKVPLLWRIHAIHHSDTVLDISTTYRHHPFEVLLVYVMTLPVVILLAPPVMAVLVYQAMRITIHILAHSNIYLPEVINKWLLYLVVTPDFHRLHHCSDRHFTDSNYGTILPWFDYLFGTASKRPFDEQLTMEIGLEYARDPIDSRIDQLLLMPFRNHKTRVNKPVNDSAG